MIAVHSPNTENLDLEAALLIYGGRYVTRHGILREAGRPAALGPGQPIERSDLARLLRAAGRDVGIAGWVSPAMIYIGPELLVWKSPPKVRPMFFELRSAEGVGAKALAKRAGTAIQPSLVWAVTRRRWYVWAHLHNAEAGPKTPLFQAPYLNVYDTGEICTGNAAVPREISPDTVAGFERAFYESRFTHTNARTLTTHPDGIYAAWLDLLDLQALTTSPPATFPDDWLHPLNLTLGDVVRRLTKDD